jgi:hypothetical protein
MCINWTYLLFLPVGLLLKIDASGLQDACDFSNPCSQYSSGAVNTEPLFQVPDTEAYLNAKKSVSFQRSIFQKVRTILSCMRIFEKNNSVIKSSDVIFNKIYDAGTVIEAGHLIREALQEYTFNAYLSFIAINNYNVRDLLNSLSEEDGSLQNLIKKLGKDFRATIFNTNELKASK